MALTWCGCGLPAELAAVPSGAPRSAGGGGRIAPPHRDGMGAARTGGGEQDPHRGGQDAGGGPRVQ
eukprot:4466165-Pyramimonas_sp.AAC.3